jgi:hypothetical protein
LIGVKRGQGVARLRGIEPPDFFDFDTRSSKRTGRAGLFAVAMVFVLTGCASDGNQGPVQESKTDLNVHIQINLDGKPTMRLTDKKTGVSVSTSDTCQAYNQSPSEIEFFYNFMACTHAAAMMETVPVESRPPKPDDSLCAFVIEPDFPSRLKRTMDAYCTTNPAQPIENALDIYRDETLERGTFE